MAAFDHSAAGPLEDPRALRLARLWCLVAAPLALLYLARQFSRGWTDGAGHPFGEDFINFWSGARLSLSGRWERIYDLDAFHRFQEALVGAPLDLYHYSYPPLAWLLTAPFGALPYPAAWLLWQVGGWLAFALAVRRIAPSHWLLVALAGPAVFVNALGGQNGCWTAAIIGWGLILLRERPAAAGALLALFLVKPQLAWLIPLALLAGRQWRALAAFCGAGAALLLVSLAVHGIDPWFAYAAQGALLKAAILEDGSGTWHRMMSVFVFVRHAGAPLVSAYGAQALASLLVAILVFLLWRRERGSDRAKAGLVLGMVAGSLYVSDYDLVMAMLAALWLWPQADARGRLFLAALLVAPLFVASIATATQLALCALLLWPAFLWAAWPRLAATGSGGSLLRPQLPDPG